MEHAEPGPLADEAAELLRATLKDKKLPIEIAEVKEQAAERDWVKAELFRRKGNKSAQATYCELILRDHPRSSYATKARAVLAELDPKYRSRGKLDPKYHSLANPDPVGP